MRFCVLASGSSGNATLVEANGTRILLDAGLGVRELSERVELAGVEPGSIAAVFVSHEHDDHAGGAAGFSRKWGVRLCGTRGTFEAGGFRLAPIAGYDLIAPGVPRVVGGLTVEAVPVPHDAAQPVAFVLSDGETALGHATDFGYMTRLLAETFRDCDAVLVESNYDAAMLRDGAYPWMVKERIFGPRGHLSNDDVANYLFRGLGQTCRTVVLAHISRANNHPEVARMAAELSLQRRGRTEVRLEVSGPEGTGWIDVQPGLPRPAPPPKQLRLW
ncbi:MAG TPA: MBL fold metallo-hydrolase [Vicinamibacteria bacterium]|jgi:phosphoribosyl 1,2-cyclic phosphodiesterase